MCCPRVGLAYCFEGLQLKVTKIANLQAAQTMTLQQCEAMELSFQMQ